MNPDLKKPAAKAAIFAATTILLSIATLWAWNAVAELFGMPTAQFKHVVAAAVLISVGRCIVFTNHNARNNLQIPTPGRSQ